jgi:F420-0:gamma-glutamyl ligase-like protein
MTKYQALAITTRYWKPKTDYLSQVAKALEGKIEDGDFVIVSEKALSTAEGNMIDESKIKPSLNARFIAAFWMRLVWGYILGVICHFGQRLINRLRNYPLDSGSKHKQVILELAGLFQALMFGSEGAIDGSNLPYAYVSLPLDKPEKQAEQIYQHIKQVFKKNVCIIIVDTDKTYRFRNFFFTPRPKPLKGITSLGGVLAYVAGRFFVLKRNSTPLAVAGFILDASEALKISNIADKVRGPGCGGTVWDMAARFKVQVNMVNYDMLSSVKHKPIVIVRKART